MSRMDWAVGLFLAVQLLTVCLSPQRDTSLALSAPLVPAVLVYYLISAQFRDARSLRWVCLAVSSVALVLATAVLWTAWRSPWTSAKAWATELGNPMIVVPNDFSFHALAIPLSALLLLGARRAPARVLAGLSITVSLATITLLRSRVSLLTAFISLAVFAALRRPKLATAGMLILGVVFVATDAVLGFPLLRKFGQPGDPGVTGRAALWSAAWTAFLDSPWRGLGPHLFTFEGVRWVHNLYLEALAEQGLAGPAALAILLGCGLWYAWKARCSNCRDLADAGAATFAALAGYCFAAFFELTFLRQWVPLLLFTLLGFAARLHADAGPPRTIPRA